MRKIIIAVFVLISLLVVSVLAAASEEAKSSMNPSDLEKVTFIHYKKGFEKHDFAAKPAKTSVCYKLMGVKWLSLPVSYVINPTNTEGLSANDVTSAISTSAETWDSATGKELFNNAYSVDNTATYGVYDHKNAIVFDTYSGSSNVIAVTSVWYTRGSKQIVEFDILFNDYFNWGDAASNSNLMDLQNIATHELGHSVGLSDLYNTCTQETMYGYSTEGDLIKRDLNTGDIAGLTKIYG